jgi:tetratricopeptide (TPR) repeat protein
MSEPLRTNPADPDAACADVAAPDRSVADHGRLSEAERAARIEELLLSGLDQYFGGRYERAINIWTRVAFLERGHSRARAYIERARDALAERQRESEEWLHAGIAAYHGGDLEKARDLLTRALDVGGPNETALVFLQRVSRASTVVPPARVASRPRRRTRATRGTPRVDTGGGWTWSIIASVVVSAAIVVAALAVRSWIVDLPMAAPTAVAIGEPLPVIRGSDLRLARARDLDARGQTRDALRLLAEVDMADPLRGEADRLTSDIQRRLLGLTTTGAAGAASTGDSR